MVIWEGEKVHCSQYVHGGVRCAAKVHNGEKMVVVVVVVVIVVAAGAVVTCCNDFAAGTQYIGIVSGAQR